MRRVLAAALVCAACSSSSNDNTTTPTAATPAFAPGAGTYHAPQSVTITSATAGAAIHYTSDGSTPTASSPTFSSAINVAATTTLKAIATASGQNDSAVASATYTMLAATPTFSPAPATYAAAQSVTLTTATPGATLHYTTDGSTPTAASPTYAGAISLPGPGPTTTTIKAIAVRSGFTDSAVASATYTIDTSATPTATPTFSPAPGTYTSAQSVTLSCATAGAAIYYTTDGSDPTTLSTLYAAAIPVAATTTVKAIATAAGHTASAIATATYTINLPQAATPTFSPAPATYTSAQDVTVSSATAGAILHCTTDGSTPTAATPACAAPIHVASTTTIKAIATHAGYLDSAVATGIYVINTGGGTDFTNACTAVLNTFQSLEESCNKVNPALFSNPGPFNAGIDCAALQKEITANLISYDRNLGATCVTDTSTLTCSSLVAGGGFNVPASCTGSLTGLVATNGSCYSSDDCANGFCTSDFSLTCPGTCQPFVALNGDCTSAECAAGLVCDFAATTPTCATPGALNGACPCAQGLWCDPSGGTPGVCKAPLTAGGACTGTDPAQCAVGYTCVGASVFPPLSGTCQLLGGSGTACGSNAPCGQGYYCPSGTCVSWPSAGACDSGQTPFCIGGYCDFRQTTPICVAFKADGATCTRGLECASGYCDATSHCAASSCTLP